MVVILCQMFRGNLIHGEKLASSEEVFESMLNFMKYL